MEGVQTYMAGADAEGQMALLYSTVHTDNSTEKDPEAQKTEKIVKMTETEFLVGEGCFAKVLPHSWHPYHTLAALSCQSVH